MTSASTDLPDLAGLGLKSDAMLYRIEVQKRPGTDWQYLNATGYAGRDLATIQSFMVREQARLAAHVDPEIAKWQLRLVRQRVVVLEGPYEEVSPE